MFSMFFSLCNLLISQACLPILLILLECAPSRWVVVQNEVSCQKTVVGLMLKMLLTDREPGREPQGQAVLHL